MPLSKAEISQRFRKAHPGYDSLWRKENEQWMRDRQRSRRADKPWVITLTGIQQRCENPKARGYKDYGGRGIKNFLTLADLEYLYNRDNAWAMMNPSIDRIDNDGNYEFSNCRYIENSENVRRANFARFQNPGRTASSKAGNAQPGAVDRTSSGDAPTPPADPAA